MSGVIAIGEVMVEMAREPDGRFSLAFGGDTFNTSVYLARLGVPVTYATALGDDPYSTAMAALAHAEGVSPELMVRVPGRSPGLYLIETDSGGERHFFYWRDNSPARDLFELDQWGAVGEALVQSSIIYFSGITLSLYSNLGLGRFLASLELARSRGTKVVFDSNFRPRGWKGDVARARTVFVEALKRVDIALPSFDDEALMWGDASPAATLERLSAFGIPEIALKAGAAGATVVTAGESEHVPAMADVGVVDTTAAGDSFNAAYLAARIAGKPPADAARAGHALAAQVIQHRGAIIPRANAH
jgi:2-dehydro-3-deoxygluconokinase